MIKKIIDLLLWPINKYQEHRKFKKRIKELRAKDPFIYK
jgi:hypothetical protein